MRRKLEGGRIVDPLRGIDGVVGDLWIEDGRIVPPPADGRADEVIDVRGRIVMAGGIDMHSHIAGGKVNIARLLMPEEHRSCRHGPLGSFRAGSGRASPATSTTGYEYIRLGYTMAFEPAMLAANARHAHEEMADIPLLDRGAYVLLGSDDLLLSWLAKGVGAAAIGDLVRWTLAATGAIAVKIVNPGGIAAFKWNGRQLDLDEPGPYFGIRPRQILYALADAVDALGVPHPIHVHGCNLGAAGSRDSTLATIRAMEGRRIHLTHLQFHSYGREGKRGFSSGAPEIAELVNANPNVSIDVGQVMFGQTVTASGDTMRQFANAPFARPRRAVFMDIECEAGCGVLPMRYRERNFVNALQWAIGLELFLLVEDPWRIVLTTDHPNGAPFLTYPHLVRLLMDRDFRMACFEKLHPGARELSILPAIRREYSLFEIAILTRAGPARLLGIDREYGHLGAGAVADIAVYADDPDRERMFAHPLWVFRRGEPVVRDGQFLPAAAEVRGGTHLLALGEDVDAGPEIRHFFRRYRDLAVENFAISPAELERHGPVVRHPLRPRA
ncbi:Formyltransferase/hydrolase complex Fhc subunit A [bacterium HR40]|nr:Formyltransferase/hydrolase complex Fhc subunit A [bacterium HR40]